MYLEYLLNIGLIVCLINILVLIKRYRSSGARSSGSGKNLG